MRCVVCGVGNRLRGDDAVGPIVVDRLREKYVDREDMLFLDCGGAPENFLSKICDFHAEKVIIVDAVTLLGRPGAVEMLDVDRIRGILYSTHQLPLSLFIGYLQKNRGCDVVFVGVQPKDTGFGEKLSDECRIAIGEAVGVVLKAIL
ncbi:MAG: hydrogenase 3 maturation endopeptidase HyCI [archaeon]